MMSVGLHCRLARPGRAAAVQEFLDYAKSYGRDVWICTREDIANHWYENHLPRGVGSPIQPNTFRGSSGAGSSLPWGGSGGGAGGIGSSGGDTASRFNFLGNLTVPRDQQGAPSMSPANNFSSDDGDII